MKIRDNIEFLPVALVKVNLLSRYIFHTLFTKLSLNQATNVKAGSWNQQFQLHSLAHGCAKQCKLYKLPVVKGSAE